jgi:hypothetical protein
LILAMSAICRSHIGVEGKGDKKRLEKASELMRRIEDGEEEGGAALATLPLLLARGQIEPHRAIAEKALEEFAKQLPIAHVVEITRGLGFLGLAGLVGEAGAIGEYRSVSGLWKRMGVAVIRGEAQGRRKDRLEALEHGFAPARRAVVWNIGNQLIGALGKGPRPRVGEDVSKREDWSQWQVMFVQRLRYEAERDPEHRRPDNPNKHGEVVESFSKHAAARAKRYVEKAFLKWLWCEWRRAAAPDYAPSHLPSDAAHIASDTQRLPGRAGRRPIGPPKPSTITAGATNLECATHDRDDTQLVHGRARRRPRRTTKPMGQPAGATNSQIATHSASDTQLRHGRARRQPDPPTEPTPAAAGANNSKSATHRMLDTQRTSGRARRQPIVEATSRSAPAGATNSKRATPSSTDTHAARGRARHRPTEGAKLIQHAAGATNSTLDNG